MNGNVRRRSVGTRGGCGEGWGPCACARANAIPLGFHDVPQDDMNPTRTSTRLPHPPHPAPCPYKTGADIPFHDRVQALKFIKDKLASE